MTLSNNASASAVHTGPSKLARVDKLGFDDPELIRTFYAPNLELARSEGRKLRGQVKSAARRKKEHGGRLLGIIDMQWDFGDLGRLPVAGTFDDLERLIKRIKRGVLELDYYSAFLITHDYHPPLVVHGPDWWEDELGNPPDVSVPVHMELVDPKSRFPFLCHYLTGAPDKPMRPRLKAKYTTEEYAPHLKATGQGNIWVFTGHCRIGTEGACLIPALAEVIEWASAALDLNPTHLFKGFIEDTDWFGPFRPCMDRPGHPQGGLQTVYMDEIRGNRVSEFTGEADDFCVRAGMRQEMEYYGPGNKYGQDPEVLKRIRFITDCTSAIVKDDPASGRTPNADFRKEMQGLGIQMINHDSPMDMSI